MILSSLLFFWIAGQQPAAGISDVGPKQVGEVALRLECNLSSGIRFSLANIGSVDTTLFIGANLGNGRKYMLGNLTLAVQDSGQPVQTYHYSPPDYPPGVAGRVDDWLQALPARSAFGLNAKPEDFLSKDRLKGFRKGSALKLTLVVPAPPAQSLMLKYWAGTLTSNTCVTDG